ncbi:MAG: c-type cytochrome [Pirellulales bacterium]|nr:c-type cytochrome [Pirellulales bacterium]
MNILFGPCGCRLVVVLCAVWGAAILGCGNQAEADTEYPHIVDDPPLSPQEQLKKFHLPAGFEIQLVAAEPDVHKPMNFNFDAAGRLWFTGSEEYPYAKPQGVNGRDTIKVIDGFRTDGSATRITTFADNLIIPIGVVPVPGGAIGFSIPNIYHFADADGDGTAEKREIMFGPFGQRDTHGLNNSFTRAIDGWIYACHGYVNSSPVKGTDGKLIRLEGGNVYRFRPDGSHIEFFTHGQVNPFGLAFDSLGNLFSADCHTQPAYLLLRGAYYPSFDKPHDGLGFGPPIMKHSHGSTGLAGIACYEAEQFPAEYRGNLFIGNPITHIVNRDKLVAHGSSFEAVEQSDFLTCDDPWFRPVEIKLGPDGALYVGDFYNCIIGHYEVPLDHPKRDRERGRIWRVVYTGDQPSLDAAPNLAKANADELIQALTSTNITVRNLATNELVDRMGDSCARSLTAQLADKSSSPSLRAHGLWVLERLGALEDDTVRQLQHDPDRRVRIQLLKALAERDPVASASLPIAELAREQLTDDDAFVCRAAADCLGRHRETANVKPLLALWKATPAEDEQMIHTVRMALRDHLMLPEVMSAVGHGKSEADIVPEEREKLAELCLGIPAAPAAGLALDYLKDNPRAMSKVGDAAYPLLRHIADARLNDVYDLALAYRKHQDSMRTKDRDDIGQEHVVLIGLQRAAQERGISLPDSITAWAKQLATELVTSQRERSRELGVELARELKLRNVHSKVAQIALNGDGSDVRLDALLACVAIDGPASVELLDQAMTNSKEELRLRQRAARSLGTVNNDAARGALLKFLPTAPERLAVEMAGALAESMVGGEALLATIVAGKASPRLLQEPNVAERLKRQPIDQIDEQIAKLTAGQPSRDEQLRLLIEDRLGGFRKIKVDSTRGKTVFAKNCATCHKIAGEGNKIGPELDGIGIRGPERVMEDVLDPSRNVDQAFRTTMLVTDDGQPVSGLVLREEGKILVLADNQGKEVRVEMDKIEPNTRKVSPLSPMPANVRDLIPEEDFYQLIGFLLEQQPKK